MNRIFKEIGQTKVGNLVVEDEAGQRYLADLTSLSPEEYEEVMAEEPVGGLDS